MLNEQKINKHIDILQQKHDQLDREIREISDYPSTHQLLNEKKFHKLHIKDEIEKLKREMIHG